MIQGNLVMQKKASHKKWLACACGGFIYSFLVLEKKARTNGFSKVGSYWFFRTLDITLDDSRFVTDTDWLFSDIGLPI